MSVWAEREWKKEAFSIEIGLVTFDCYVTSNRIKVKVNDYSQGNVFHNNWLHRKDLRRRYVSQLTNSSSKHETIIFLEFQFCAIFPHAKQSRGAFFCSSRRKEELQNNTFSRHINNVLQLIITCARSDPTSDSIAARGEAINSFFHNMLLASPAHTLFFAFADNKKRWTSEIRVNAVSMSHTASERKEMRNFPPRARFTPQ